MSTSESTTDFMRPAEKSLSVCIPIPRDTQPFGNGLFLKPQTSTPGPYPQKNLEKHFLMDAWGRILA